MNAKRKATRRPLETAGYAEAHSAESLELGAEFAAHHATDLVQPRVKGAAALANVRPYLSAEQLCDLTPWTPDAIEKLIRRGVLKRGVHYFQPLGRRSRLFFKWEAIVQLIEGQLVHRVDGFVVERTGPHGRDSGAPRQTVDVEKATAKLRGLLA